MRNNISIVTLAVFGCMCLLLPSTVSAKPHNDAADFLVYAGESHLKGGEKTEAIHEFSKALMIQPDNKKALSHLKKLGVSRGLYKPMRTLLTEYTDYPAGDYAGLNRPVEDWSYDDSYHVEKGKVYAANAAMVPYEVKNQPIAMRPVEMEKQISQKAVEVTVEPVLITVSSIQPSLISKPAADVKLSLDDQMTVGKKLQKAEEVLNEYVSLKNSQQLIDQQAEQISRLNDELDANKTASAQLMAEKEILALESKMAAQKTENFKINDLQKGKVVKAVDVDNKEVEQLKKEMVNLQGNFNQKIAKKDKVIERLSRKSSREELKSLKSKVNDLKDQIKNQTRDANYQIKGNEKQIARLDDHNKALKASFIKESTYEKQMAAMNRQNNQMIKDSAKDKIKDADMLQVFEDYLYLKRDQSEALKNKIISLEINDLDTHQLLLAKMDSLIDAEQSIDNHRKRIDQLEDRIAKKAEMIESQGKLIVDTTAEMKSISKRIKAIRD